MSLDIVDLVRLAGILHFSQIVGMLGAGKLLDWERELLLLSPINRAIAKVIGIGILITGLGLGTVVVLGPDELAGGSPLGVRLALFLTSFWTYRAGVQLIVYRKLWPQGPAARRAHHLLSALFITLALAYGAVFVHGARALHAARAAHRDDERAYGAGWSSSRDIQPLSIIRR
jgi:hypothetical protein